MTWDAHKEHVEHAKFCRERMDYVLGDTAGLKMQVGKHEAMNWASLKSVHEEARQKCPRAADTIAWMLWRSILDADRLAMLTKDQSESAKE